MSFSMTTKDPGLFDAAVVCRRWLRRVVFPLPKVPEITIALGGKEREASLKEWSGTWAGDVITTKTS
jgi:hypothetical protein